MSTPGQLDIGALLQLAGATPPRHGRGRWGCPECGRPAHVSVDFHKEAFHCWHAGCGFRGYRTTLEKRLGLSTRLTPTQQRERRQVLNESRRAAEWLAAELRARRFELYEAHQALLTIVFGASARLRRDISDEIAWAGLAHAYLGLDPVRAALGVLESAPVRDRLVMLNGTDSERKEIIRQISERGGLCDGVGRFIAIDCNCPGMLA